MASHIHCGRRAPQPHHYPPQHPSTTEHGITSDLQQATLFHDPVVKSSKGDLGAGVQPLVPRPSQKTLLSYPDPQLCITPEKGQLKASKATKSQSRVHFDCTDDSTALCLEDIAVTKNTSLGATAEPDPDLDVTAQADSTLDITPQNQYNPSIDSITEQLVSRADGLKEQISGLMNRIENVSVDSSLLDQMGYSLRPSHKTKSTTQSEADSTVAESEFARPEFNTTLRIKAEIDLLKRSRFDPEKALKEGHSQEDDVSQQFPSKQKNVSRVEVTGSLYDGVTSVDLHPNQLLGSTRQTDKKKPEKHTPCSDSTQTDTIDPREFCTPELLAPKIPQFTLPPSLRLRSSRKSGAARGTLAAASTQLRAPRASDSLQLYRRIQAWQEPDDW